MTAPRPNAPDIAPEGIAALRAVETYLHQTRLGEGLIDLVKMRVSQINGCAHCLDMHSKALRRNGESEQRIYLLNAWHESPLYSPRERAALAWTEALTRVADAHPLPAICDEVRKHFDDRELADLTILIGMINLWNRLAIGVQYVRAADEAA